MRLSSRTLRVAHAVAAALFTASAVVQLNDPDPVLWVLFYGVAATVSAVAAHGRWSPLFAPAALLSLGLPSAVWLLAALPPQPGLARTELAREAGGLLLVSAWMAVVLLRHAGWPLRGPQNRAT